MQEAVVLKNRQTNAYLGEDNRWQIEADGARLFPNPYHALYFCVSKGLKHIDIIARRRGAPEVRFLRC
jgi:hypothetical protein